MKQHFATNFKKKHVRSNARSHYLRTTRRSKIEIGFRLDLLVEDKVIVEIKSVEKIAEVHHKQLLTYLKLSQKKLGLLVNFNTDDIGTAIFRKVNGL
jgi:GxxExxY protein